jgi:glycosyltransferase involved in cell wall biosynthesis
VEIALITEGTYPHSHGGVSVWCDQLVRGLAPHTFSVYAIAGTGTETMVWDLPDNVTKLVRVPLWGPTPSHRQSRAELRDWSGLCRRLVECLVGSGDAAAFQEVLAQLMPLAERGALPRLLSSNETVRALLSAMVTAPPPGREAMGQVPRATVADAVTTLRLVEHYLRPLWVSPPRADVCHAAANGLSALTALASKIRYNTPFVLTEHGIYLRERYLDTGPGTYSHHVRVAVLQFFKLLSICAYQSADVIAPGSEYNRQWEEINGATPGKIRPIYNGVDAAHFPVTHEEPEVPTITFVGRIDPLKDIETLLRAFAKVRTSLPDARLRIFGSTPEGNEPYHARCVRLQHELGLGECATFEGRVASVVDAYHAGHVVALTSISEGFPYALIEAMATGRPTVSTNVGGVREAVGDAGYVVPPRNPEAIADACLQLLNDPDERQAMGTAARERILSFFTVEQCLALYSDLYREVTGLAVSASVVALDQSRRNIAAGRQDPAPLFDDDELLLDAMAESDESTAFLPESDLSVSETR